MKPDVSEQDTCTRPVDAIVALKFTEFVFDVIMLRVTGVNWIAGGLKSNLIDTV